MKVTTTFEAFAFCIALRNTGTIGGHRPQADTAGITSSQTGTRAFLYWTGSPYSAVIALVPVLEFFTIPVPDAGQSSILHIIGWFQFRRWDIRYTLVLAIYVYFVVFLGDRPARVHGPARRRYAGVDFIPQSIYELGYR
jgi:hypothetical protein